MGCAPSVKVSKNIGTDEFKEGDDPEMKIKTPKTPNAFLSAPRTSTIFRKYQSKMVLIIEVPKED